jgi:hypothetical protein
MVSGVVRLCQLSLSVGPCHPHLSRGDLREPSPDLLSPALADGNLASKVK